MINTNTEVGVTYQSGKSVVKEKFLYNYIDRDRILHVRNMDKSDVMIPLDKVYLIAEVMKDDSKGPDSTSPKVS